MAITFVTSTSTTSYFDGADDARFVVTSTGVIVPTSSNALRLTGERARVTIDGAIVADAFSGGILTGTDNVGSPNSGGAVLLQIGPTGSIAGGNGVIMLGSVSSFINDGRINASQIGLQIYGNGNNITNNGSIVANAGAAILASIDDGVSGGRILNTGSIVSFSSAGIFSNGGFYDVTNAGLVGGGLYGVKAEGDGNSVFNSGTIESRNSGLPTVDLGTTGTDANTLENSGLIINRAGGVAVSGGGVETVRNLVGGEIRGNVLLGGGGDAVSNLGTIYGNVDMGSDSGADSILNSGVILGDVFTGGGADTFVTVGNGVVLGIITLGLDGDQFYGGAQNDVALGGAGNDSLYGGAGDDTLTGGGDDDFLRGGAGADDLDGGFGNDTADYGLSTAGIRISLFAPSTNTGGAAGDNFTSIEAITAGSGNDTLEGGAGNDTLNGAGGLDAISFANAQTGVVFTLASGGLGTTGVIAGYGDDTYSNMEWVEGSAFADSLGGNASDNRIFGGQGDDSLRGGSGADVLDGGAGIDIAEYTSATANNVLSLANPSLNTGGAAGDTFVNIEGIRGGLGDDTITGDGFDNILHGGTNVAGVGGNDLINGGIGGFDTAAFDGLSTAYTWTWSSVTGSGTVTHTVTGDVDTLQAIDRLKFDDTFVL